MPQLDPDRFDLSAVIEASDFTELEAIRAGARDAAIEGVMLKRRDSPYVQGRRAGLWYKWKRDPLTADCVMMYAQRGNGRRSSWYSDYTFGCWTADGELLPVGKAYQGITDQEIAELDKFVRTHTLARFGPVREVEKTMVLEVAFDSVHLSTRHKSGVAMRFPSHRADQDRQAGGGGGPAGHVEAAGDVRSRPPYAARVPLVTLARLHLTYAWQHRRRLRLAAPSRLTEWIQHRKLHDRDPRLPGLLDKVTVKAAVAKRLGAAWVTPTLWHGRVLPDHPPWPMPFVVKARHGCGQIAVVRSMADWPAARARAARWAHRRYGYWLDEWAYAGVPRGLLVEPFIGEDDRLPLDYKFCVFGGRVAFGQVHLDRATDHRWIVFDRDWRRVSPQTAEPDPPAPATLDRMIAAAELLARDHDFMRVDFYEVGGRPRFGEFTVYPGSGLLPVVPQSLDQQMGELWRSAHERRR